MKLKNNQLLAVVYADLFDFPLKAQEIELRAITQAGKWVGEIENRNGYYFLAGRGKIVKLRQEREEIAKKKLTKLLKLTELIKLIPTVEGIFVTGSVAASNAKADADLDLLLVCAPGTMWLTRLMVVTALKTVGVYRRADNFRDKVCTNMYLTSDSLKISNEGLYEAQEILQAQCIYDRGGVEAKWLKDNRWVRQYLPKMYDAGIEKLKRDKYKRRMWPKVLLPLEVMCYWGQKTYMRNKITNELVSFRQSFFHPRNLSEEIKEKFDTKKKKYIAKV